MTNAAKKDLQKVQFQDFQEPSSRARAPGPHTTLRILLICTTLIVILLILGLSIYKHVYPVSSYKFHFDIRQPLLHTVSDKFLSFGLDTSLLRRMNEMPIGQKKFVNLAYHLSPAYVRVGGTSADCLTFVQNQMKQDSSEEILSPVDGQDISNFTISDKDFLAIYNFTVKSELRMIFDLNVLLRNPDGSWNDSNAKEIIAFAKSQNMSLDWQLGNEPNSFKHVFNVIISATELAMDYDHLRQLLNVFGYENSILVGPEVNHVGESNEIGEIYAKTFLSSQKNTVNYVSWHQYYLNGREAKVEDFVKLSTFNWLPAQISSMRQFIVESGKDVSMWLSETSTAFGGGAPGLSDRFVAGFLWLDKLGYSAKTGVNVVTRQSLFGGDYAMVSPDLTPNPDWWVSIFYKQFVSEKVLKLDRSDNLGYVRLYAHCTPKEALIARMPAVTVYGMNLHDTSAYVNITELFSKPSNIIISYYALTADNLQSSKIKLNGEVLKLLPDGELPPFRPVIIKPYVENVSLPPYSMVFMIIHGVDVPACSTM
ncbi:PREDICTED: heparanase-like [Wasmannia auropunctata]|uniref:heparanase-like n=1 Tax=Wasmannia auropunctata TaxID=64793 RepID=UPI0005EF7F02|nr:PREDICTED: heparanase-like [Wasmannia auropunctata]